MKCSKKWSAIIALQTCLKQMKKVQMIVLFQSTSLKLISQMLSLKSFITKMRERRKRKRRYLSRICCCSNNTFFSFRINYCWNNRNRDYMWVKNTMILCYWISQWRILWLRILNHFWKSRKETDNHFLLGNSVRMKKKSLLLYHNSLTLIKWSKMIGKCRFQNLYRFYHRYLSLNFQNKRR